MIWLTWRQFRTQAAAACAILVALAAVLVIAGQPLFGTDLAQLKAADVTLYEAGIVVMYLLPAIIGAFWGAPLITRELEAGTHRLVWNQTVTRTRWLATKLAVTGLAAAAVAGLLSLAVTWWADPIDDALDIAGARGFGARVTPLVFGARGIVPVGHAVFAFMVGVAIGVLLRRTVLTMAVTLAVVVGVQLGTPLLVRPYLMPSAQETVTVTPDNITMLSLSAKGELQELAVAAQPGAWILSNETIDAAGNVVSPPAWLVSCLPPPGPTPRSGADEAAPCFTKLADEGYRQRITYQPASRFWALQWIETALFLALAGLLAWVCARRIRRLS
ncbi:transporter [Actinokineospora sp. HUAS TT18]|uniref:transporter n=1 Tax=Actinokineospora sp. HUAS TT18 TaxID=3447451 RepID=UPI003F521373